MGLLDEVLGGASQAQHQDFVNRYEQGAPSEGYSDREVMDRYQQVATELPPDQYQQAAQQSFERLSPQERMQFGQQLQQGAQAQGYNLPGMQPGAEQRFQEPGFLAQLTGQVHQQQPNLLGQLLGGAAPGGAGGGNSLFGSPVAKAAMAGVAAMALKNMMGQAGGGRGGSLL